MEKKEMVVYSSSSRYCKIISVFTPTHIFILIDLFYSTKKYCRSIIKEKGTARIEQKLVNDITEPRVQSDCVLTSLKICMKGRV